MKQSEARQRDSAEMTVRFKQWLEKKITQLHRTDCNHQNVDMQYKAFILATDVGWLVSAPLTD